MMAVCLGGAGEGAVGVVGGVSEEGALSSLIVFMAPTQLCTRVTL